MKRDDALKLARTLRIPMFMRDSERCNEALERFAAAIEARTIERCATLFDSSPNAEMFRQDIADEIRALKDE